MVSKLRFSVDSLMSATDVARNFSEMRRRAKAESLFITDRNVGDSVQEYRRPDGPERRLVNVATSVFRPVG